MYYKKENWGFVLRHARKRDVDEPYLFCIRDGVKEPKRKPSHQGIPRCKEPDDLTPYKRGVNEIFLLSGEEMPAGRVWGGGCGTLRTIKKYDPIFKRNSVLLQQFMERFPRWKASPEPHSFLGIARGIPFLYEQETPRAPKETMMSTKRKKKCSPTVRQQQRLTAMLRSLSSSWSALRDDKPLIEQHGFERDMAMLAGPEGHVIAGHVIEALFLASLYPLPNDVVTNIDWRWELVDFARNRCEVVIGRDMERDLRIMEKVIPSSMDYNPTMETLKQFWLRRDMPGQEVLWRLERRGFVPVSARELIGAYPGIVESGFCAVALGAVFCEAFLSASREGLKFMQPIKRGTIILAKPKMA